MRYKKGDLVVYRYRKSWNDSEVYRITGVTKVANSVEMLEYEVEYATNKGESVPLRWFMIEGTLQKPASKLIEKLKQ